MKQPFINAEEKIDRFVGRRTQTPDPWKAGMQLQETGLQLQRAFGHRWRAKGVQRFKTHAEADQWMINMLVQAAEKTT
ncbi:MAG TPA: hypothetical protein VMV89_09255 [Candidatus Paceibacterota bacterium]|nr:hypothetical protein [Candidatus Paceibacterota bacterium]